MMKVDRRVHEQPGDEHGCGCGDSPCLHHQLSLVQGHLLKQAQPVDDPIGHSGVMSIAEEIVHPVHIYLPAHYLAQAGAVYGLLDICGPEAVIGKDLPDLAPPEKVHDALVLLSDERSQCRLGGMGKWPVAQVMQKSCCAYRPALLLVEVELLGEEIGQMVGSQAVLEAGVIGPGVDQAGQAQLPDPAQPLHLGRIGQL